MNNAEKVYCKKCNKEFYLHSFRFKEAKTVSCMFCGYRIVKNKQFPYGGKSE